MYVKDEIRIESIDIKRYKRFEFGGIEMEIMEKLLTIVKSVKKIEIKEEQTRVGIDELGISSIEFIKIIVECEMEWHIEFEPEKLDKDYFKNLVQVGQYISEKIS